MNDAAKGATKLDITFVASTGDCGADAADLSSASAPSAFTVASISGVAHRSICFNYGTVVDILASVTDIFSVGRLTDISCTYRLGMSMVVATSRLKTRPPNRILSLYRLVNLDFSHLFSIYPPIKLNLIAQRLT